MPAIRPSLQSLLAVLNLPRLLAILALALTLLAIPAFTPDDASAMRMSEATARRTCQQLGGTWEQDIMDPNVPWSDTFHCTQLFWELYECFPESDSVMNCY